MSEIVLGDITLDRVIGRGGMAVVWRGRSKRSDREVAVKVLTDTDDALQRRRFRDEIRAVARLRHRGIVDIVEMGTVPDPLTDAGPGLKRGSPWLAMEYVRGGTLRDVAPQLRWRDARSLLSQILEALGHAHARGIIHRDLKPANVLVSRHEHGYRAQISDFGIAYTRGLHERDSQFEERVAGTPRFMAPEQIEGRWRDHGPWTDLYAVGCIAYWLVSGRTPFGGDDVAEILRGQLYGSVEPIEEEGRLPDGFDRWVGHLLQKRSARRYRFAADASYGLRRLGAVEHDAILWQGLDVTPDEDATEAFTQREWASVEMRRFKRATLQISPGTIERPPVPRTWRTADAAPSAGAGLSLFRLRTPPLVGRQPERDLLWDALRTVDEENEPRCVVLSGRSGTGKSRLAEWTANRAVEVGAATRLVATHAAEDGSNTGIGVMFARHLECFGLTLEQVEDRLRHWWSQTGRLDHQSLHDTRVLARFMPVEKGEERDSGIGLTIGNSFETFERAVRVIAADRPVYLWLDDVQWSPTSIRFAHWLVRQSDLPVVIVATVREDALETDAREALDELLGHARSSHCEVGPLSSDQHRAFVRSMLPLDDAVADEIARRSAGNPLFAVQLLGQCVDREILVEGERGLEITAESRVVLPDDVRSVWLERVANAVADLDADHRGRVLEALELAAALGAELEDAQWRHACSLVGLSVDETVLQPLLDARLVERFEGRWRFAHGTLREALEHRARDAGRWHRFCRACAESARWFGPRAFGEGERRRASYFLQAGDRGSALRPMLAAARRKLDVGRLADCAELRERHQTLCDELGLDANDSHRVENLILKARESLVGGDLDAAVAWGRIAVDRARDAATGALVSRALVLRGDIMRHRTFDEAVRAHDEALEIIEPTPPEPYIRALLHAAETRCFHPTYEQASKLAEEAIALAETHDLVRPLAHAHFVRAISIRQRGDFDRASREISVAHRTAERTGRTNLTARCEIEACLIHRLAGDRSTALRWGQRARNRLRAHGPSVRAMVELEVQLARLDSMTPVRAVSMLTSALRRLGAPATDVRCAEARFHLAAIAARSDDLQSARRYVEEGRPAVEVGAFDRAMAIAIDKAADAMMQGAAVGLAEKLWALAQTQWRQLGTTTVGLDDRSH